MFKSGKDDYPQLETEFIVLDGQMIGLFMQDPQMKSSFHRFPEVLMVDATHKTSENEMPLYALMTVDGNGESEVVAVFLTKNEDESSLRQMLNIFKSRNPAWEKVKVVVSDKDMAERTVFKPELPQIHLQICLLYVLRTFSREITPEKMNITSAKKETILSHIQGLAYAHSEHDFNSKYEELKKVMNDPCREYFERNWYPIKEEWVEGVEVNR